MRSPEDMLAHALAYAKAGLEVLPLHTPLALPGSPPCACGRLDCGHVCTCLDRACGAPGKHPRTRHGKDDATDDLEQVRAWWARWPCANIGVRPAPGTAIVDVDLKSNGPTALHKLTCAHGGLVPTWTARTGGGGLHIWFRATGALKAQLCQGVDLKAHTGYVVMPPACTPAVGATNGPTPCTSPRPPHGCWRRPASPPSGSARSAHRWAVSPPTAPTTPSSMS